MVTHVFDFTGDGWPDILATESRPMVLYVNPGNVHRRWADGHPPDGRLVGAARSGCDVGTLDVPSGGRWGRSQSAGGAEIHVSDVSGDGRNDVVSALHGHGWGLAWFEQRRDASGAISFVRHMIMDNYSTPNACARQTRAARSFPI